MAGPFTDRFGRIPSGIYAVGALRSAFATDTALLLFARTLIGLVVGADSAIATAYIRSSRLARSAVR
jgi:MFS transporter, SP family, arabinose:H+ symporter